MKIPGIVLTTFLVLAASAAAQEELTYVDLVKRLTDLEALAVLPQPGDTCGQASSYDRDSYWDRKTGKYLRWDANRDGDGIMRIDDNLELMADLRGPGCVWRIWSAEPGDGCLEIFCDNRSDCEMKMPFKGYFDLKNPPFVYPSLVHGSSSGFNSYIPIPFQKFCRIRAEKGWGKYYHFTYQLFPKDAKVPVFNPKLSPQDKDALEAVDKFLAEKLGADPAGPRKDEVVESKKIAIEPGKTAIVIEMEGEGAITAIKVKLDEKALADAAKALRAVLLRIFWDGDATPAVLVPLGDFFGTAPGINKFKSLPLGVTDEGFYSYWYMPFAGGVKIELVNEGDENFNAEFAVTSAPLTLPAAKLGRFHAKWHRDAFPRTDPDRSIEWVMLTTEGRGRFCGVMLHVWNPRGGWWGEGDEKFYVDGEKFPSTFGTGSEDYFGYAWCNPALFQHAFHNQTRNDGENRGHISVNRWHIADNVGFQKSFEATIEKYFPNSRPTLYACTVYWYLESGGKDPYGPEHLQNRHGYFERPSVFKADGAVEFETLKVLEKTCGSAAPQDMADFGGGWSDDSQLWWTSAKPGAKLVLSLPVEKTGKYELKAQLTKAADYGIVQLSLDGKKLGGPIDLYNEGVIPGGEVSLGVRELSAGEHKLAIEITGANEKAAKSYMVGLDYLKLVSEK